MLDLINGGHGVDMGVRGFYTCDSVRRCAEESERSQTKPRT
jgi:hypothetical protein